LSSNVAKDDDIDDVYCDFTESTDGTTTDTNGIACERLFITLPNFSCKHLIFWKNPEKHWCCS